MFKSSMHKFKGKPLSITHLDCEFHEGDTDRTYISRSSEDEEMLKDNTKIKEKMTEGKRIQTVKGDSK